MRMHLVAVGQRMPAWVNEGYREFARRLPPECSLDLIEVEAGKRGKNSDFERLKASECERLLKAASKGAMKIALDQRGQSWSSDRLASLLSGWLQQGREVAFLIGGADGLTDACRADVDGMWSLSPLTLPHAMVRIIVAEQLYRAWTIYTGHPYHRA